MKSNQALLLQKVMTKAVLSLGCEILIVEENQELMVSFQNDESGNFAAIKMNSTLDEIKALDNKIDALIKQSNEELQDRIKSKKRFTEDLKRMKAI